MTLNISSPTSRLVSYSYLASVISNEGIGFERESGVILLINSPLGLASLDTRLRHMAQSKKDFRQFYTFSKRN